MLLAFLEIETISLRQIQHAMYLFRLVLYFAQLDNAEPPNYNIIAEEFCTALILHLYDPDTLRKFLREELSDKDVVETLLPSTVKYDSNLREERLWFETTVIRAAQEIVGKNQLTGEYEPAPLLLWYTKIVESTPQTYDVTSESYFASILVKNVDRPAGTELPFMESREIPRRFRLAVK